MISPSNPCSFNVVLANPPYSIKQWDRSAWSADPWGRNIYGTPPQGRADYAFWQHIINSMNPKSGRCAILFPHGVLFRNEEVAMREKLIAHDIVECVLGLGPNLFYNSVELRKLCCQVRKVEPLRRKLSKLDAWICGLRREQSVTRDQLQKVEWDDAFGLIKINPLAGWTTEQVWEYIKKNDILFI